MADHDGRYKLFFSHRRMVADLLRGFLREDWVARLDLATLERVSGSFVGRDLRQRHGDMVWRVRPAGEEDGSYVYLLLEFQSSPDRLMPLRLLGYETMLLEELVRRREISSGGRLPPVIPVVLHNGPRPWSAPLDLRSLFAPAPGSTARYLPQVSYVLVDEARLASEDLEQPANAAAVFFQIETRPSLEGLVEIAGSLPRLLPGEEDTELRLAFFDLVSRAIQRVFPGGRIPEIENLEDPSMMEDAIDRWREGVLREAREKGLQLGIQQGLRQGLQKGQRTGRVEGMRQMLLRLIRRRFGPVPKKVQQRVAAISSQEELERLADRVLVATTLEEMGIE
ncbi:MAG TPA: Rpn family recombination-promoting nuclease/putative transposase [Thermoanaerobaculia bacterium]|nr:Rpn family recombination-promoting nuclease/putative transposase [Thermoanaerobaculia bacterium]